MWRTSIWDSKNKTEQNMGKVSLLFEPNMEEVSLLFFFSMVKIKSDTLLS